MANPEHMEILKQGVEKWNRWREENPEVIPNLSGADLREAYLVDANLIRAILAFANLSTANLTSADLFQADLSQANLVRANLARADLFQATLFGAALFGANLVGAKLPRADLNEAALVEANLRDALLLETTFANTNLSDAKGLEACHHQGPSTIDHRTLAKSGPLPLKFLRGCGLPDTLIEYIPSLLSQQIQFYSCFISYSSQDDDFAQRLHADLQDKGVRCWFAPEHMKIGDRIRIRIDESIRIYDKLLLVLSENSIASDWVEKEVETAFEKERERKTTVLFPIRLDDAVMDSKLGWAADIKRTRHIGDFTRWKDHDAYQKAFQRLLHDLRAETTTKSALNE